MTPPRGRRTYLDLMRGIAVLIMIEAHVIDSWTRVADRGSPWFGWSLILGGFGAPLFLFFAGIAVALSAGSKSRRMGDRRRAAAAVRKRGLEIFLLAFLFRLQAFVISHSSPRALLKVDILNLMGPAIMLCAWVWGVLETRRARAAAFTALTFAIALATPIVRATASLAWLPDFIEAYIRPVPSLTNFAIFPWAAFVPAGAAIGVFIDAARDRATEARVHAALAAGGLALAASAYAASYLPSPYAHANFWTSSPCFFFLRLGLMMVAVAAGYLWERRRTAGTRWSPLQLLGQRSLFVYWIHVEMVYGLPSTPIHGALTLGQAWAALGLFCVFILMLVLAKDRLVWWWTRGRPVQMSPRGDAGSALS